jgi:hypothetical protein
VGTTLRLAVLRCRQRRRDAIAAERTEEQDVDHQRAGLRVHGGVRGRERRHVGESP